MATKPSDIDFGRSYLRFATDHSDHTPRLDVDAACTLVSPGGEQHQYFLTCECIGEAMYIATGLIHDPVQEFNVIVEPDKQLLLLKRFAKSSEDIRSVSRFGEKMPTRDGKGATLLLLEVGLARHKKMKAIYDYKPFRKALLEDHVINGRTTFTEEDGTRVILEYPCRTINVHNSEEKWQVDAGPIVMPVGPNAKVDHPLQVAKLDMAFMVYNRLDYAEAVIRRGSAVFNSPCQYGLRRNLQCKHELFVAE